MTGEDYIQYLICRFGEKNDADLFRILASRDYTWQLLLDENRAQAGLYLREQCAFETGVCLSDVADGPCSCLEMLCALSTDMADNCDAGNEKFFMTKLLDNLGIRWMRDQRRINDILDAWLNRNYPPDGKRTPIYIKGCTKDLRTMDVWSQMHLYLNTYYPLDKEFLQ